MEGRKLKDILPLAIAKEIGAADFYTQAADKAKNSNTRELLLQLAREEEKHQKMLETLTPEKIDQARIGKISSFITGDDTRGAEFRPGMSFAGIFKMAITMEDQAFRLYDYLRETADDDDLRKIFTFLANEEAKHRAGFEKLYAEEIAK